MRTSNHDLAGHALNGFDLDRNTNGTSNANRDRDWWERHPKRLPVVDISAMDEDRLPRETIWNNNW